MKKLVLWLSVLLVLLFVIIITLSFLSAPAKDEGTTAGTQAALQDGTLYPLTLRSPEGAETELQVEVADTKAERAYGLMNRAVVTHGMLFVFSVEEPVAFWMKSTLVPLDIAYFNAQGQYVSSTTMDPCRLDPCKLYPSEKSVLYALEMPKGFLEQTPVGPNWTMQK